MLVVGISTIASVLLIVMAGLLVTEREAKRYWVNEAEKLRKRMLEAEEIAAEWREQAMRFPEEIRSFAIRLQKLKEESDAT